MNETEEKLFNVEVIEKTYQDYLLFDKSANMQVYVVEKDGQIIKMNTNTKTRFKLPLVQFDNNFVSAMNQIIRYRYESGALFKMAVEKEGRVGFFSMH